MPARKIVAVKSAPATVTQPAALAPRARGSATVGTEPASKAEAKPAPKVAPQAVGGAKPSLAAKPAKAQKAQKTQKALKPAKIRQKPVRDSFTMPEADFSLVATLKARALAGQRETKKSELLRAGLHALAAMDSATLLAALHALEPIKTGRPRKGH